MNGMPDSRLTLWGGPDLFDYASKLWGGLVRDFYVGRWRKYFSLLRTLPPGKEVPSDSLIAWEEGWTRRSGVSPATPLRNPLEAAEGMLGRWSGASHLTPQPVILPDSLAVTARTGIDVSIHSDVPAITIRYTLDGTLPNDQSPLYAGPIHLSTSADVSARAFLPGKFPSFVSTQRYSFVDPSRNGLVRKYFEGTWQQLPDFDTVRVVSETKAYDCTLEDVPHRPDYFGLRYAGYLNVEKTGDYIFVLGSDDGSRLRIDSLVVVNNDGLHAYGEKEGTVHLEKGSHAVQIDYFEYTGAERLRVLMEGPGLPRGLLPPSALFSTHDQR